MKNFLIRLALLVGVLTPFVDTEAKKNNRLIIRKGADVGTVVALNRPLPFNDPGFNCPASSTAVVTPRP